MPAKFNVACVTMMKDEEFFLPIWFRYYSSLFGAENLYIIDHASEKSVSDMLPSEPESHRVNVIRIPPRGSYSEEKNTKLFDGQRFSFISQFISGLLTYFDAVIFNDTDELYVPDPLRYPSLTDYLAKNAKKNGITAGFGVELFQIPETEPAFDIKRTVFSQRENFFCSPLYSKPHILTIPSSIKPHTSSVPFVFDPDLLLVHMKHIDEDQLKLRQKDRQEFMISVNAKKDRRWSWDVSKSLENLEKFGDLPKSKNYFDPREICGMVIGHSEPFHIGGINSVEKKRNIERNGFRFIDYISKEEDKSFSRVRHSIPNRFKEMNHVGTQNTDRPAAPPGKRFGGILKSYLKLGNTN